MKRLIGTRNLLFVLLVLAVPAASFAGVAFSITVAPPLLPVYVQPPCPVDGYIWTPGYWAWGPAGYYWVPGAWVAPPAVGLLWTPGYWGFAGGIYSWHAGYWGPHVGFYGGVSYGFGYPGQGFYGGVWSGGHFRYNTAVVNVNRSVVHNVYTNRSFVNHSNSRASFNGPGGVNARPTTSEMAAVHERNVAAAHNFAPAHNSATAHNSGTARNQVAHQVANRGTANFNHSRYTTANRNGRQFSAASHRQPSQVNAMRRTNEVAHSQPNRMTPPARPQVNRSQVSRPQVSRMQQHSAPHQNQPALQARRESRGGGRAR